MTVHIGSQHPVVGWDFSLAARSATGTGVYASRLLQQLATQDSVRIRVFRGWNIGRQRRSVLDKAAQHAADIVWTHGGLPVSLKRARVELLHAPAFVAPLRAPCPTVITVLDTAYLRFPEHYARWWVRYLRQLMPLILRRASAVITISEHSKDDITEAYGLAPEKVRVTSLGVDRDRFHPDACSVSPNIVLQRGVPDGYVLHVGALVRRKNVPVLLRAVAYLKQERKWGDRRVVLAGGTAPGMPGIQEVRETITQLGLEGDICLIGHVPDEQLPGLYAHASVLTMPSMYEGFGLPLIEAMASGTPVVASAASCMPEIVGNAGLLVPPGDHIALAEALLAAIENKTLIAELRAKGLRRVQDFSWEGTAAQTMSVYKHVLGSQFE